MQFNRTKNSTRTFAFGIVSKTVTILCPFVIRTIIIYKLGVEYLGLTSLFTSVLTILNISELGVSQAIAFCLYKPIAEDDKEKINALMALMKKIYKFIGVFILCAGACLMPFLPRLINGEHPADINIYILYIMYLVNASVSYLGYAYKTVLFEAYQEGDINHKVNTIVEIFKFIAQIMVLVFFADYYFYVLMLPIASISVNIITEFMSKKKHSDIVPRGDVDAETKYVIKKKVAYLSIHSVAAKITNSIDSIVISNALGLAAIAIYGNYQYIFTAVFSFVAIAFQALKPAIGNSLYVDTREKQSNLLNSLELLAFWICTWCSICLLCLYQPFIVLWIGKKYLLDFGIVIIIVLFFFANVSRTFYNSVYVETAGLWNKTLFRQILSAIVNLILDIVLVNHYGILGVVIASFVSVALISHPMDVIVTYKYVLNISPIKGILKMMIEYAAAIGLGAITYFACHAVPFDGVLGLLVNIIVCIVVPNTIIVLFVSRSKSFRYLLDHIKALIGK